MRHSCYMRIFVLALVAVLVVPGLSLAAGKGKKQAAQEPATDEQAARILEKCCNALTALTSYSFRAAVSLDKVYQDGSKVQFGRIMDVRVKRPGEFSVATDGEDFQAVSAFDGKVFTLMLPQRKTYGQIAAAMDTDSLMSMLSERYHIESPLGDLLSNHPCAGLHATAGFYIGKAKIDGVACEHLFFQGKDVDWQIWIEDSPESLPRKLVITEKKQLAAPQFTAVLGDWKTGGAALQVVAFAPGEGVSRDDGVITSHTPGKK